VKPFAFAELSARIRALLRRNQSEPSAALTISELQIDPVRRMVTREGQRIALISSKDSTGSTERAPARLVARG
jgi:DNA-binding response OmpR family regulator